MLARMVTLSRCSGGQSAPRELSSVAGQFVRARACVRSTARSLRAEPVLGEAMMRAHCLIPQSTLARGERRSLHVRTDSERFAAHHHHLHPLPRTKHSALRITSKNLFRAVQRPQEPEASLFVPGLRLQADAPRSKAFRSANSASTRAVVDFDTHQA